MDNHTNGVSEIGGIIPQIILALPFLCAILIYAIALIISQRRQKKWPLSRTILWVTGNLCALAAVIGPLADKSHMFFSAHMYGHLLLGMLGPLLMVLAAPMTLVLRALPVRGAKRLTGVLKSWPVGVGTDPVIASFLNIGGLWILYTTPLYTAMHESLLLFLLIHIHVFLAGYLFTVSLIYVDPMVHRRSFYYRTVVFILALAAHGILSKYIYAHPPLGVEAEQARSGGMIMYYGGDAVDIILIFLLCFQWYKSTTPRTSSYRTGPKAL